MNKGFSSTSDSINFNSDNLDFLLTSTTTPPFLSASFKVRTLLKGYDKMKLEDVCEINNGTRN